MALRPFPVDPGVMAAIRPMQYRDAEEAARLHEQAMGDSLWAKLGRRFLTELYRGLIDNRRFLGFVYEEDGRVGGFIAGSQDAGGGAIAVSDEGRGSSARRAPAQVERVGA